MVTGADRDALPVQDGAHVVRVHAVDDEREDARLVAECTEVVGVQFESPVEIRQGAGRVAGDEGEPALPPRAPAPDIPGGRGEKDPQIVVRAGRVADFPPGLLANGMDPRRPATVLDGAVTVRDRSASIPQRS